MKRNSSSETSLWGPLHAQSEPLEQVVAGFRSSHRVINSAAYGDRSVVSNLKGTSVRCIRQRERRLQSRARC